MKHKDESYQKHQRQMEKNKESVAHMKELLTRKGQESRDELLREIDKLKKLAQDAGERVAVRGFETLVMSIYRGTHSRYENTVFSAFYRRWKKMLT